MADRFKIKIEVISQKGFCANGHKIGNTFMVERTTPAGICLSAFGAFYPALRTLMFGGTFPWSENPDIVTAACPDAENPVVFKLQRIRPDK